MSTTSYLIDKVNLLATKQKKSRKESSDMPLMPFDEALKCVWSAPPAPKRKPAKRPAKK